MAPPKQTALERYNEINEEMKAEGDMDLENDTPLEKLRFFCSMAMSAQDWLDVESFFTELDNEISVLKDTIDMLEGNVKSLHDIEIEEDKLNDS